MMEKFRAQYQIDKLKALFTKYSSFPIPTRAQLLTDSPANSDKFVPKLIKVNWQYRDTVQLKTIGFQKNYLCTNDMKFIDVGLPEELPSEISLQAFSRDGKKQAVLKSKTDAKSTKPEQFIVLYDQKKIVKTIDVKSLNDQLTIIESATYSSFVLNDNGTVLLCVVEVSPKTSKSKEDCPASKDYDVDSHEYKQSWGEKLGTIFHSSIALIDLENEKLVLIEKSGLSLIQPFFFKSSKVHYSVGCVGLQELPYKLGLIYCSNRISFLLGCNVSSELPDGPIEPEIYYGNSGKVAISSPRVYYSPTSGYDSKAIFLERDAGGAHNKSARLQQFCFESRKSRTIIDNKQRRELINDKTAYSDYGPLFVDNLPDNCFTLDGNYAVLNSETPLSSKPFVVDLQQNELKLLKAPHDYCEILDVKNDWIVALGSSINCLPNIYLSNISNSANLTNLAWVPIEDEETKKLPDIKFETFAFPSRDYTDKLVTCIWTSPVELADTAGPTVILPHGGPHVRLSTCYYQSIALYTAIGLKTCLVNYVGSTGVDEDYVEALLGNIGTTDVNDVYDAIQYVIANKKADKDRIILSGGSHGGFLVTQLSGKHSELNFLACIARNPVIDIAAMSAISDIPDWTCAEALGDSTMRPFSQTYAGSPEEVAIMHKVSPIAHITKVKVPTLLLLGKEDLRVPYTQGLLYHRILKARGVESRCFVYDDCHSLQKISVEFDCFLNMVKFIENSLKTY